jgi:hypothetical protein
LGVISAPAPVGGGRCFLTGREGDAINVILTARGNHRPVEANVVPVKNHVGPKTIFDRCMISGIEIDVAAGEWQIMFAEYSKL